MANDSSYKYITVAYKLFAPMEGNDHELIEEATPDRPFQFISGMGLALDAFERIITATEKGATFDFTLSIDEAYGPYVEEGVQKLARSVFEIDGRLNKKYIFEGAVVPLQNADGERFNGTITEIGENEITVDLNHPLAGKPLNFVGTVTENREATNEEIQEMVKAMSSGCGNCSGCGGGDCESGCGGCNGCQA
ncbi:MAG: peptidylprolyl isomerase [Bacteroidaceae bacterium]|nr:peptidylprolyl isomerase [Bacteroidaceae bacterium]